MAEERGAPVGSPCLPSSRPHGQFPLQRGAFPFSQSTHGPKLHLCSPFPVRSFRVQSDQECPPELGSTCGI